MNQQTHAVQFFLAADANSATNRANELNSVRAAFDQWAGVPGTKVKFEEAGLIAGDVDANIDDGTNVVFWAKSTLIYGGRESIAGRLALTYKRWTAENYIAESDIVLNGTNFLWFTDFFDSANQGQFVEGAALHEIGHLLGLAHSPVGGATMFARAIKGVSSQAGLSADEIFAARTMYPAGPDESGHITGHVTSNGNFVPGAVVTLENEAGCMVVGSVTDSAGYFDLGAISAGNYNLRVSPLDANVSDSKLRLVTGADIHPQFSGATTAFLPSENIAVAIGSGETKNLDLSVISGEPAFRITRLVPASPIPSFTAVNAPIVIMQGQTGYAIGVCSPTLPISGATFSITGDGLTIGPIQYLPNAFPGVTPAMNIIYAGVNVSANATPGLRTLIVRRGTDVAFANGFLDVQPAIPDFNFDGLDDRFQRRNFPLFTSPMAAPASDPDGDNFPNSSEAAAGTNPLDANSNLKISQIRYSASGASIQWQAALGKSYIIRGREEADTGTWQPIAQVTATNAVMEAVDANGAGPKKFYRVEVLK